MVVGPKLIDRAGWARGPWSCESDRLQWRTEAGLTGLVVRNDLGALCGYVAVPSGHPLHGKDYGDVAVEVHGGLTYSGECSGHICHEPGPGESDDVWWLGFDCAHAGDLYPSMTRYAWSWPATGHVYRDIRFVCDEVERLAQQLSSRGRES